jgi:hypothetical protein
LSQPITPERRFAQAEGASGLRFDVSWYETPWGTRDLIGLLLADDPRRGDVAGITLPSRMPASVDPETPPVQQSPSIQYFTFDGSTAVGATMSPSRTLG